MNKIFVLNSLSTGLNSIELINRNLSISGIIGLSNFHKKNKSISGFIYMKNIANNLNIDFVQVESYNLKSEIDKKTILKIDIDILIVIGWQRLIPNWLINHVKIISIGGHGSPFGIKHGKGRSPLNWSLILGLNEFLISIFKIDEGIDSGEVLDTTKFRISDFDDINTLYSKVNLTTSYMIIDFINQKKYKRLKNCSNDDNSKEAYLPKRIESDGVIDWSRNTISIHRFINALKKPYPLASTNFKNKYLHIKSSVPYNLDYIEKREKKLVSGQILEILHNKELLVKTGDGSILINFTEKNWINNKLRGEVFESISFENQIKKIVARHYASNPKLKLNKVFKKYE